MKPTGLDLLKSFFDYQDGWDGYSAVAPNHSDIELMITFYQNLAHPVEPDVTMESDGTIVMIWKKGLFVVEFSFRMNDPDGAGHLVLWKNDEIIDSVEEHITINITQEFLRRIK